MRKQFRRIFTRDALFVPPMVKTCRWPACDEERPTAAWALLCLWGLLLASSLMATMPKVGQAVALAATAWQLGLPLLRADAVGHKQTALGLGTDTLIKDVALGLGLALVCLPVWALMFHITVTWLPSALGAWGDTMVHALGLKAARWRPEPIGLPTFSHIVQSTLFVAEQCLGVALPEEVFFRGYICAVCQTLDARPVGPRFMMLRRGDILGCLVFGIGHIFGSLSLARMGPAFVGLILCSVYNRRKTLYANIVLHALCNAWAHAWPHFYGPP